MSRPIRALHREGDPVIGAPIQMRRLPTRLVVFGLLSIATLSARLCAQDNNLVAAYPGTDAALSAASTPGSASLEDVYSRLNALEASVGSMQSNPSWQQVAANPDPNTADLARRLQVAESQIRTLKQQLEVNTSYDYYTAQPTNPLGTTQSGASPPGTGGPTSPFAEQGVSGRGISDILNRLGILESAAAKSSQPTFPSFRITGFSQLDHAEFAQSANSRATVGDIQNGTGFRRTRIAAAGNLTEQTKYWLEMDFAAVGRPSFMDVWGEQSDIPFIGNLRIGQFRQPITLDGAVNVRHLEFMEYSSAFFAFDPFRRVGIGAWFLSDDERTFVNYSVYGTGSTFYNGTNPSNGATVYNTLGGDNRFGTILSDNGAVSAAIRATHLLYWDEMAGGRYFLHLGGGYNFSETGGNRGTLGAFAKAYQARSGPEIFVGDPASGGTNLGGTPNVIDTGRFLANDFSIYHVEMCGNYGSGHFQTEYIATVVDQTGGPQVFLDGAYFQCGYYLTGESCGYNKNMGAIDYNVTPISNFFGLGRNDNFCGWGAWEVAGRVSWLDLSGGGNILAQTQTTLPPGLPTGANPFTNRPALGGINQGQLTQVTLALNWWWNPFTRLQLNYIYSMADTNNGGNNGVVPAGAAPRVVYGFNSLSAIGGRFQFEF